MRSPFGKIPTNYRQLINILISRTIQFSLWKFVSFITFELYSYLCLSFYYTFITKQVLILLFLNLPHNYTDFWPSFWILVSTDSSNQFVWKVKMKKKIISSTTVCQQSIDAINLANIIHHKKKHCILKTNQYRLFSHSYTLPIASKIFNYERLLQNLEIEDFKAKPPDSYRKILIR